MKMIFKLKEPIDVFNYIEPTKSYEDKVRCNLLKIEEVDGEEVTTATFSNAVVPIDKIVDYTDEWNNNNNEVT